MGLSIDDLIGRVKMPVRSVAICLDADLQAEHDELTEQLEIARRENITKMGDTVKGKALADRIGELEAAMRESEQRFRFKGLNKNALNVLYKRFPTKSPGQLWDIEEGAYALLAATAVEPEMTEAQASQLLDAVSQGQADALVSCAWAAATGSSSVPLSVRASELRNKSS
jgi:hypothetical protein